MNEVVLFGSSGFLGGALKAHLKDLNLVTVDRHPSDAIRSYKWDGKSEGEWAKALNGASAVINLSGSPIAARWTDENQRKIMDSRVESTRAIGRALANVDTPPTVWINGSALGYYGDRGEELLNESSSVGTGFRSEVSKAWEEAALSTAPAGVRLVLLRTGIVLGASGGALAPLSNLAKAGLGGAAGSGKQWVSWIHVDDFCRLCDFASHDERVRGPINACAPNPARNSELMKEIRHALHRPWSPPVPPVALKVFGKLFGPEAELLLGSQRGFPELADRLGFTFNFPELPGALRDLVGH